MKNLKELIENSNLFQEEKEILNSFFKNTASEFISEVLILIQKRIISLKQIAYYLNKKQQILNQKDEKGWEKLIQEEAKDIETFLNKKESSKTLH